MNQLQSYGGIGAVVAGLIYLLYQYFRNKYFTTQIETDTKKEQPVVAAIAADAQKTADDKSALQEAENALNRGLNDNAGPSTSNK